MEHLSTYVTMSEIARRPVPLEMLPPLLQRHGGLQTFLALAKLAALMANSAGGPTSPAILDRTNRELVKLRFHGDPLLHDVGEAFLAIGNSRAVAHEQAIYFLQALALVYGRDEGGPPTDDSLALMLLAVNDYMDDWLDDGDLDELEHSVAGFFLSSRFSGRSEHFYSIIRVRLMYRVPPRSPISSEEWRAAEVEAFGMPFGDYFDSFVLPLVLQSTTWCKNGIDDSPPVIHPSSWFGETRLGADYARELLKRLVVSREVAAAGVRTLMKPGSIPHAPQVFFRTPFLELSDDAIVAASPYVVRDHLHLGIWAGFMAAFKRLYRQKGAEYWLTGFGDLFEAWCRRVVKQGLPVLPVGYKVHLSEGIGGRDEIEDVVFYDAERVVLVSIKAWVVPEDAVRQAASRAEAIKWLRRQFYQSSCGSRRAGAIPLLDNKVAALRAGAWPQLNRNAKVFPVVITFDDVGDNAALYSWLDRENQRRGLLKDEAVAPLTVGSVSDFEAFMQLVNGGANPLDILEGKTREQQHTRARFRDWLHSLGDPEGRPPSWAQAQFAEVAHGAMTKLFEDSTKLHTGEGDGI
ncbi:MAG: hypothetical protein H6744_21210 [Deltaproteobacteria bacterium]|nr:hypothetical protein [Deltaproteobacteria bacterium]